MRRSCHFCCYTLYPHPLIEQLKIPGYLVFPMGEKELQTLVRIRKDGAGIREEYFGECHFVKLRGRYGLHQGTL